MPGGCPGGMLKLRFDWYINVNVTLEMQKETRVGSFDVHFRLSIFGARLSNSVPKKGRDPSCSISMVNFNLQTL